MNQPLDGHHDDDCFAANLGIPPPTPQDVPPDDVEPAPIHVVRSADPTWEDMLCRLLKYKAEHGDPDVPIPYPDDIELGAWVSAQRLHYKILMAGGGGRRCEPSCMNLERVKQLEDIGFQWTTKDPPRHVPWQQRYEELVEFKERYGHSQVPIGWVENIKLSNWVSTQRQEFAKLKKGRKARLTKERMNKLNSIEFVWEAQRGGPRRSLRATVAPPRRAKPVKAVQWCSLAEDSNKRARRDAGDTRSNREDIDTRAGGFGFYVNGAPVPMGSAQRFPSQGAASPWQMLPHGAYELAFPPTGLPAGQDPAFLPMTDTWQLAAAAGFQYGMATQGRMQQQKMMEQKRVMEQRLRQMHRYYTGSRATQASSSGNEGQDIPFVVEADPLQQASIVSGEFESVFQDQDDAVADAQLTYGSNEDALSDDSGHWQD